DEAARDSVPSSVSSPAPAGSSDHSMVDARSASPDSSVDSPHSEGPVPDLDAESTVPNVTSDVGDSSSEEDPSAQSVSPVAVSMRLLRPRYATRSRTGTLPGPRERFSSDTYVPLALRRTRSTSNSDDI
ncbi:hypothetical protein FOL47_006058, partial [Perkinsus chesapeaki]